MFSHLTASSVWFLLGATGATLFYSRFLVQWLVSERAGRCVVPVSFWYLSSAGTLALLVYALAIRSPLGALGQCFNIVVYTRNLVHIGRKRGSLTPLSSSLLQGVAAVVAVVAIVLSARLWLQELHLYPGQHGITTPTTALWLVLGLIGQILFALRFLIQWIATERSGESTVPAAFWHLSVVASIL
jgi:lipid-A-disaccharide synthase-like uncharacterized protein